MIFLEDQVLMGCLEGGIDEGSLWWWIIRMIVGGENIGG